MIGDLGLARSYLSFGWSFAEFFLYVEQGRGIYLDFSLDSVGCFDLHLSDVHLHLLAVDFPTERDYSSSRNVVYHFRLQKYLGLLHGVRLRCLEGVGMSTC